MYRSEQTTMNRGKINGYSVSAVAHYLKVQYYYYPCNKGRCPLVLSDTSAKGRRAVHATSLKSPIRRYATDGRLPFTSFSTRKQWRDNLTPFCARIVMVLKMTLNIIDKITKWLLKVRHSRIILARKVEREATCHL